MNPVTRLAKLIVDPWVGVARAVAASPRVRKAADATAGSALRLVRSAARAYIGTYTRTIPNKIINFCEACEKKGDALCYGRNAPWTIAPGMLLRKAGRAGRFARDSTRDAYSTIALTAVAVLAASFLLQGAFLPALFIALAFPPAVSAAAIAGTAVMMAAGAAGATLPALLSIGTGLRRRQEAFDQEEKERKEREWEARKKLPPLDRDLHATLDAVSAAQPHERVEWFEALKAEFSEEFAAAAAPGRDEVSPVLQKSVQLGSPLRLKKSGPAAQPRKPRFWGMFSRTASR